LSNSIKGQQREGGGGYEGFLFFVLFVEGREIEKRDRRIVLFFFVFPFERDPKKFDEWMMNDEGLN